MFLRHSRSAATFALFTIGSAFNAQAATPSVAEALKLSPVQAGVDYDSPTAEEAKSCTIKAEKIAGVTAWVVRGSDGAILREFSDSNGDNVVDTWSYYRGGLEVYRDVDANFNGKADQYRWFHTAGSRWGLDKDEDGKIDSWKMISAEEASEEVVQAVRNKDAARFARLVISPDEVSKLGLAKPLADKLADRIAAAPKAFAQLVAGAKIDKDAQFTDFGGLRPGMVPAGARGGSKDLLVYEDAWAMVHTGGQHQQLQLGTMINLDGCWKLVDGPMLGAGDKNLAGFFYDTEGAASEQPGATAINQPTDEMQRILESIEKLDKQIAAAETDKKPDLNAQRADLLEKLAAAAPTQADRDQWIKQLADMLSAAVQDATYPDGFDRLKKLEAKLADDKASEDLLTHLEFRRMQASYGVSLADTKDYAKVQEAWLKQLEDFVNEHKSSEHVAEALLQLAMHSEYAGDNDSAQKWYERLAADFPNSPMVPKARGAVRRLTCAGQTITLKGSTIQGGAADLAQYRGKAVLIHYWSTTAPSCKADHEQLQELYEKYGGAKFDVIGVSLDYNRDEVAAYLKEHKLPWKQLFEPGGFENRFATEMGIITAPFMILVDEKGQVVSANIQSAELESALKKLVGARVAAK